MSEVYACPKCGHHILKRFHSFCNATTERVDAPDPSCESCINDPKECKHKHFTATIEKKIPYCEHWFSTNDVAREKP
jgi:hypothetical protein